MNFELLNKYSTVDYLKRLKNKAFHHQDLSRVMDFEKAIYITRKSHAKLFLIKYNKVVALSINVYNEIVYALKDNALLGE